MALLPPDQSDDPLVSRAARGDDGALEELLREVDADLRARVSIHPRWARSLEVDDVMQVSYLEAFLRIGSLRERSRGGFRAWMARLVDHNLRDALKGLERDKRPDPRRRATHGDAGESARTLLARISDGTETAGGAAVRAESVARLHAAIAALPATYRAVVEALDLAERDVGEVATELGRSRGAVHLLRSRAHLRLAELLRHEDG
ncbi:MAG: sigma-70 family RNA polymerase sigma factor [Planctomycetota bacterium]